MKNKELFEKTLDSYKEFISSVWNRQTNELDILHASMLLYSEGGEIVSAFKKHVGYNKDIDPVNLLEELGDLLFSVLTINRLAGEQSSTILTVQDFNSMSPIDKETFEELTTSSTINLIRYTTSNLKHNVNLISYYIDDSTVTPKNVLKELLKTIAQIYIAFIDKTSTDLDYIFTAIMYANINKLNLRFGGSKYNPEKVLNRELEKEYSEVSKFIKK